MIWARNASVFVCIQVQTTGDWYSLCFCLLLVLFRFIRQLQVESQERDMQEKIITSQREKELREKQLEQEERLAKVAQASSA